MTHRMTRLLGCFVAGFVADLVAGLVTHWVVGAVHLTVPQCQFHPLAPQHRAPVPVLVTQGVKHQPVQENLNLSCIHMVLTSINKFNGSDGQICTMHL